MNNANAVSASSQSIQTFTQLVAEGAECWKKAGEVLVELVDGGLSLHEVSEQCGANITVATLTRFEQIGRGLLLHDLLICEYPAAKYMARLPFSEQRRIHDGGVDVIIENNGTTETLKVSADNLTSAQCRQVFDGEIARSASGQKAYITSKSQEARIMAPIEHVTNPYTVRGRKCIFNRGCELSAAQIARILVEMA